MEEEYGTGEEKEGSKHEVLGSDMSQAFGSATWVK